jgi:hypothetical protein
MTENINPMKIEIAFHAFDLSLSERIQHLKDHHYLMAYFFFVQLNPLLTLENVKGLLQVWEEDLQLILFKD